ncbi:Carbon monoxide oxidation accessory protein CoxG [hydrothermal vent metagenome]|uniref:Carbon monoxide oxidation accessory protein CoxG n=1 Tax=hydrothermal vent metagenome TaxID=652676 RepID=A0A160VHG3_9ZZZZ
MKVEISKTFSIRASINDVWDFMTDIKSVSTCIPGAQYNESLEDNEHSVMLTVKVGPIKSSYRSKVAIKSLDKSNYTMEIEGSGTDTKGKGGANMEMTGKLIDNGDGTTGVTGDSIVTIQGMLAQFGSRMIEDVSNQLFVQFTENLRTRLEGNGKNIEGDQQSDSDNSLSGTAVAWAAIKGVVGRIMRIFNKK